MGTWYTFKCNKCGYQVTSSGGKDYGMLAVVDTYVCKSCEEIVDVCIGEYGETYKKEEAQIKKRTSFNLNFYQCPECGSDKNLAKWNKTKRPCPKCDGKMEKHAQNEIILWD